MAVLYTPHFIQFFDGGEPLSGGKLYTYAAGTTTPKASFTTAAGNIENANPVVLDSEGRAVVFIEGSYRFDLFDSNDVLIESTDGVTSFTATGTSEEAYFESFSGDGANTSFTTSIDLGTDEKLIMIFVDNSLRAYQTNGTFATDSGWTKGSGWSIGSGVATASTASTDLEQTAAFTLVEKTEYVIQYTITRSSGTVTPKIGGTSGTSQNSSGTYTESIIAGSTQVIAFEGSGFSGTVDNVTVTVANGKGFEIQPPSAYTINGTTLTIPSPPADGTGNVMVWAPAKLATDAAASAAAAAASESAAANSANNAAASEDALTAETSTTSTLIGTGSKIFTISSGKAWSVGQFVLIASDADETNYMFGQITAYSGTDLTVNVTAVGGAGTFADWKITLSGIQGVTGAQGPAGGGLAGVVDDASPQLGGNLDAQSTYRINNLVDPSAAQDAATKAYVDASGGGATEVVELQTISNDTNVDFTTDVGASGTYKSVFEGYDIAVQTANVDLSFQFSTNGGSSWDTSTGNYVSRLYGQEDSGSENDGTIVNKINGALGIQPNSSLGKINFKFEIIYPAGTSFTYYRWRVEWIENMAGIAIASAGGFHTTETDVDAVRFTVSSDDMDSGFIVQTNYKNA